MKRARNGLDCLCSAAILSCIVFGLFGCIFFIIEVEDAKRMINNSLSIFITFSVLCSFLYYSKWSVRIGMPFMIIFLSFITGIFRKQFLASIQVIVWNMLFRMDRYYGLGWEIKEELLTIHAKTFEEGLFVLLLIVIFLLSIDTAGFLCAGRIFIVSILILIFGMCVGKIPSGIYVFLLLIGLFGLCAISSKSRNFQTKWKFNKGAAVEICCREQEAEKETIIHGEQKAAVFTVSCFLVAVLLGLLFQRKFGEKILAFHTPVQNWANELEYSVLHYDYNDLFREIPVYGTIYGTGGKRASKGRLSNFEIQYSGKEVMKITVDTLPRKGLYLRGFIGKDYEGNHWSEIDAKEFSKASASWGIESKEGMEQEVGNLVYSMLYKKEKFESYTSKMRIDYVDVPGNYAYLPYFTEIGPFLEFEGDGIINRQKGQEEDKQVKVLYTKGFWKHSGNYYRKLPAAFASLIDTQEWEDYTALERQYANYVEDHYLTVPKTVPTLKEVCEEFSSIGTENIDEQTAARFIRKYLKNQASYSIKDLKRVPYGQDFVEYFLYTQQKGYCIHFATAAVLMYRMLGIPARFVEGYVVWPEDFVKNEEGTYTASIPDSRAHAWAEVYYQRFGFMPIDMTPGNYELAVQNGVAELSPDEDPANSEEIKEDKKEQWKEDTVDEDKEENEDKEKNKEQEDMEKKQDTADHDEKKGAAGNGQTGEGEKQAFIELGRFLHYLGLAALMIAFVSLAGLLFLAGNIFYHRRKYKKHQKKLLQGMEDKKRREVIRTSCRFYEYLKHSGIEREWKRTCGQNISDREYEKLVRHEFVFLEHNEYHRFREIVQKAFYCPPQAENIVSEKEVGECREFVELMKRYLLERLPWYKRVLVKGVVR